MSEIKQALTKDLVSAFNDGYEQGKADAMVYGEWKTNSNYPDKLICSLCWSK